MKKKFDSSMATIINKIITLIVISFGVMSMAFGADAGSQGVLDQALTAPPSSDATAQQQALQQIIAKSNTSLPAPVSTSNVVNNNGDASSVSAGITSNTLVPGASQSASALTTAPVSAPLLPDADNSGVEDQAFASVTKTLLPLTPDQVKTLHYLFDRNQEATQGTAGLPPKPTSSSVLVNLSPGATPPVIRLSAGFITSLVFLDASGSPWPITAYDLGDPKGFNVQWDKKSNTLLVQALSAYHVGNLAVMLQSLDTPVMITLLPGQQAVDYRVDLRIPGMGPNSQPTFSNLPDSGDPQLLTVLDGIPPQGAEEMGVQGGDCQAWLVDSTLYLRTRLSILSPGWIAMMTSADGMHAYRLEKTPLILVYQRGKITQLTIEGL